MAAAEDEFLGENGVGRASRERSVVHVLVEEVGVVVAGGSYGRELRVEEEIFRRRGGGDGGGSRSGFVRLVVGCEVVDGGADSVELTEEVVGDSGDRGR